MRYDCAIITGASAGLGEEFAKQLAPHTQQIVLVARRGDRLEILKSNLLTEHPELDVICCPVDLNDSEQRHAFLQPILNNEITPDLLINNAGMGDLGTFAKSEWDKVDSMLSLNMNVLTQLCHAVAPGMKERKNGHILNVSSMASIMPIPDFSAYAATKAYVTSFSEALRLELNEDNIHVTALCPGPVHTEFGNVATRNPKRKDIPMKESAYVRKEKVVAQGLAALQKNKPRIYPGFKIRVACHALRWTPLPALRWIMGKRPRRID